MTTCAGKYDLIALGHRPVRWTTTLAAVACAIGLSPVLGGNAFAASEQSQMTGSVDQGGESSISAHGSGSNARGELNASTHFHAKVTCLQVTGNDGIVTAVIDQSTDPAYPAGEIVVAEGVDNGNPRNHTSPDLWRISFESNGGVIVGSNGCSSPIFAPVPVQTGNLVVQDGR
jgi:hypothetical protein